MPLCSTPDELLDGDELSATEMDAALADLGRVHRYLFGLHAIWSALRPLMDGTDRQGWLLDVGAGSGEVADAVIARAARRGVRVRAIALDRKLGHLLRCRRMGLAPLCVVAEAGALPFQPAALDWAFSNLLFHHFDGRTNLAMLSEMRRVARSAVVIADLRASKLAGPLFRVAAALLGFGRVAYVDGCTSLRRAWKIGAVRKLTHNLPITELKRRMPFRWTLTVDAASSSPAAGSG
jgi:ubiquinone/menaquinone biosynthesis C-methylase UbiE